jgi:hypothetical protein
MQHQSRTNSAFPRLIAQRVQLMICVNGRAHAEEHELSLTLRPHLEFLYTRVSAVGASSWWRGRRGDAEQEPPEGEG